MKILLLRAQVDIASGNSRPLRTTSKCRWTTAKVCFVRLKASIIDQLTMRFAYPLLALAVFIISAATWISAGYFADPKQERHCFPQDVQGAA